MQKHNYVLIENFLEKNYCENIIDDSVKLFGSKGKSMKFMRNAMDFIPIYPFFSKN